MSMAEAEPQHVVLDNGSGNCRVGFAGEDAPRPFACAVGRPREQGSICDPAVKSWHVGDEIQTGRGEMVVSHPMEHGIVTDWDDMEKIWHHAFYSELRIEPQNHAVLVTEAVLNPKSNREKMMQIMYEKFQVPAAYVALSPQMGVYGYGRVSAICCDTGDGVTQVLPIYEGYCPFNAIQRMDFAGRDLTHSLSGMLQEKGHAFSSTAEMSVVSDVKEALCYVAEDYDSELLTSQNTCNLQKSYSLPDGSTVTLNNERFRCTEALFNPKLLGLNLPGIQKVIYDCAMGCGMDCRRDLCANILLTGGNSLITGLPERMKIEMKALLPETMKVQVIAAPERKYMAWIGGSIIASLSQFQDWWVSKADYEEYGPENVHRIHGALNDLKKASH